METRFVPGSWVRHPERPDWGIGQVQSAINGRITVNFENFGKQVINAEIINLEEATVSPPSRR